MFNASQPNLKATQIPAVVTTHSPTYCFFEYVRPNRYQPQIEQHHRPGLPSEPLQMAQVRAGEVKAIPFQSGQELPFHLSWRLQSQEVDLLPLPGSQTNLLPPNRLSYPARQVADRD